MRKATLAFIEIAKLETVTYEAYAGFTTTIMVFRENDELERPERESTLGIFPRMRSLTFICWCVAALIGLLQLTSKYMFMDPDGLSYLDIGSAYLRGDWHNAINAYWSPLFSWLLALAMATIRPTPYWEFTVVHLINYSIFICALLSFNFFLNELLHFQEGTSETVGHLSDRAPSQLTVIVSYVVFLWASVDLITIIRPTPDMFVMMIVYLVAGLTLRLCSKNSSWRTAAALGAVLGLGYLAKTAMLLIGCFFLMSIFLSRRAVRLAIPQLIIAATVFALLTVPFVLMLSLTKNRLTIGESGRLNYSWSVNKNTRWLHWQGDIPGSGTPVHPTRKLLAKPALYEFAQPISGTFPPWYDPTYWYEGVTVYFSFRQQLSSLTSNLNRLLAIFYHSPASKLVTLLCLVWLTMSLKHFRAREVWKHRVIVLPAAFAMAMYALVIVIPRYVAPFAAIMVLTVLRGIQWPKSNLASRLVGYLTLAIVLSVVIVSAWRPVRQNFDNIHQLMNHKEPHRHWQVANYLGSIGIKPGDRVASVGYSFLPAWARLARARVVSEMPSAELFFLTPSANLKVNDIFASTGAQVIVATPVLIREDPDVQVPEDKIPPEVLKRTPPPVGWQKIEDTDVYVYVLRRSLENPR